MKRILQNLALIAYITLAYFASVYFAVSALLPNVALEVGLIALILALIIFRLLDVSIDSRGKLFALLITLPFTCFVVGLIWWVLRLMGFWKIN
jgi:hypothetical protein